MISFRQASSLWWLNAVWLAVLVGPQPPEQTNRRLSDLPTVASGDVVDCLVAPVGARVVFRADPFVEGSHHLFSAPVDGSASPVQLNALVAGGSVEPGYRISPDGTRVVYRADQERNWVSELFSVPVDASAAPIKLSGPLVEFGAVRPGFQISPDGTRVVYAANWLDFRDVALISAAIDGSSGPIVLNQPDAQGSLVQPEFVISPDGTRVVYRSDADTGDVLELFSVPIGGGAVVKLNDPLVAYGDVFEFRVSPDGARVVYRADQEVDGVDELYSVPIDASASSVRLNGILPFSSADVRSSFEITADGDTVVYLANQEFPSKDELFSVPIDASAAPIKVSGHLVAGGDVVTGSFALTPDSTRVVFVADKHENQLFELFVAPLDASAAPLQLNDVLAPGGDVASFRISPNGMRVVYGADRDTDEVFELFSVLIGGGAVAQLNGPLVDGGDVDTSPDGFLIANGGNRVVYRADQDTDGVDEIYVVSIGGRVAAARLNDPLIAGSAVTDFQWGVNGGRVLYLTDQGTDEVFELYSVPVNGSSDPVKLNDPFSFNHVPRDVLAFHATERRAVFLADQDVVGTFELYSVPARGGEAVELSGPMISGGDVISFRGGVDGERVVYRADQDADEVYELFSVPEDGSESPVKLSGPMVAGGDVDNNFATRTGTSRVVYQGDQITDWVSQLFSVPADGSAGSVVLTGPLPADHGLGGFEIAPDGSRVMYFVNQQPWSVPIELYSVPIDASASPVMLNHALHGKASQLFGAKISSDGACVVYGVATGPAGGARVLYSVPIDASSPATALVATPSFGKIWDFSISPDDSQVLYLGDQEVDDRSEIFRVPIDGSAAPVKLSGPLVAAGDVGEMLISPDGLVVYWADQELDGRFELYSVPADGTASPIKLSGALAPGGDVLFGSRITPDGDRVLYLARGQIPNPVGTLALYSVPIDASAPSVELVELDPSGNIAEYAISEDGTRVVYLADQVTDSVFELFGVPIDGSSPAVRLNGPLVDGGDVQRGVEVRDDGRSVFYLADQRIDGAIELFATFETRTLPHAGPTRTAERTQ